MNLIHCQNKLELGRRAAAEAGTRIRAAIDARGQANIIVATGASQFETLARLIATPEIQWPRVVVFHLDEYLGIPADHPASFRRYLQERFVGRLRLSAFHAIDGQADPIAECRRLGDVIRQHPIDLALVGIGGKRASGLQRSASRLRHRRAVSRRRTGRRLSTAASRRRLVSHA